MDKDFPLQLWDSILPQTELSLNLLRCSRIDTPIFAWAQLHGTYDFSAHPIAPLGMRIVLHEKPHQRATWTPHGVEGFYLGPALEHYRCYHGWVIKTQRECFVDTVAWHPHNVMMPGASEKEMLRRVLTELCSTIQPNGAQLPPPAAVTLDTLQDEMSALFPAPTLATLSPVREIIPKIQVLTRQIQTEPHYNVEVSLPIAEDQRVGSLSIAHDEQRVVSKPTAADAESTPTLIVLQMIPPPGRIALPPGGDNQYARSKSRRQSRTNNSAMP